MVAATAVHNTDIQHPVGILVVDEGEHKAEKAAATKKHIPTIDRALVTKAVSALIKHHGEYRERKEKKTMVAVESLVHVNLDLQVAPAKGGPKPQKVRIPNCIYQLPSTDDETSSGTGEEVEICLFVKDGCRADVEACLRKQDPKLNKIIQIMTLEQIRKEYANFHRRRELVHSYTVFLVDDRILPLMGRILGRDFFKFKKQPVPVDVRNEIPSRIRRALSQTYWIPSRGTCQSIKVGHTTHTVEQLVDNIVAVATNLPLKVPRQWSNVRSMAVKTGKSTSLPFYHSTPQQLRELAKMAGLDDEIVVQQTSQGTKTKRVVDEEEADAQKRRKIESSKSPLVKALKEQKKMEQEQQEKSSKDEEADSDTKKKNKKKRKMNDVEGNAPEDEAAPVEDKAESRDATTDNKSESKTASAVKETKGGASEKADKDVSESKEKKKKAKKDKKNKKVETKEENEEQVESPAPAEKDKKEAKKSLDDGTPKKKAKKSKDDGDEETPKKAKKSKDDGDDETPKKKAKKSKDDGDEETPKKKAKKSKDDGDDETPKKAKLAETGPFIAAKKFQESKKGYKFQRGKEGLGYYKDEPPRVDPLMLRAMKEQNSVRSFGTGNKKKKGGANKRRSGSRGRR